MLASTPSSLENIDCDTSHRVFNAHRKMHYYQTALSVLLISLPAPAFDPLAPKSPTLDTSQMLKAGGRLQQKGASLAATLEDTITTYLGLREIRSWYFRIV